MAAARILEAFKCSNKKATEDEQQACPVRRWGPMVRKEHPGVCNCADGRHTEQSPSRVWTVGLSGGAIMGHRWPQFNRVLAGLVLAALIQVAFASCNRGTASRENVRRQTGVEHPIGLLIDTPALTAGRPQAKRVMIEYSDFECEFCGRHARDTFPRLKRLYIDTGLIRYSFVPFPLPRHSRAVPAAAAAQCAASSGKQLEMQEQLFKRQSDLSDAQLSRYGAELGLEPGAFARCRAGDVRSQISEAATRARALGVRATPTVVLGKVRDDGRVEVMARIVGARPASIFMTEVDRVIAATSDTPPEIK